MCLNWPPRRGNLRLSRKTWLRQRNAECTDGLGLGKEHSPWSWYFILCCQPHLSHCSLQVCLRLLSAHITDRNLLLVTCFLSPYICIRVVHHSGSLIMALPWSACLQQDFHRVKSDILTFADTTLSLRRNSPQHKLLRYL